MSHSTAQNKDFMKITVGRKISPKSNPKDKFKVEFEFMGGDADTEHFEVLTISGEHQDALETMINALNTFEDNGERPLDLSEEIETYIEDYSYNREEMGIPDCLCISWPNDPQSDFQFKTSYIGVSKIQYWDKDGNEKKVTLK